MLHSDVEGVDAIPGSRGDEDHGWRLVRGACSDLLRWKINNSAAALHQARLLQQMARSALLQISSPFSPFFTLRLAFRESILPALFINSLGLMKDAAFYGNTDERK